MYVYCNTVHATKVKMTNILVGMDFAEALCLLHLNSLWLYPNKARIKHDDHRNTRIKKQRHNCTK